tara:strand:- start:907 stop:1380 length:474 start_codon:yes stop_codon:yes gene_type:complete
MLKSKLPLRIGVGAILINKENKIFVGKRKDFPKNNKWQMPQGGVNDGENFLDALKRELQEETSIKSIKILKELDGWTEYELPNYLLGKIWKGKYRGQKQKWFVLKFIGKDNEINLKTKHPEFIEWKWTDPESLPKIIVDFKKTLYEKLLLKIKPFIN